MNTLSSNVLIALNTGSLIYSQTLEDDFLSYFLLSCNTLALAYLLEERIPETPSPSLASRTITPLSSSPQEPSSEKVVTRAPSKAIPKDPSAQGPFHVLLFGSLPFLFFGIYYSIHQQKIN